MYRRHECRAQVAQEVKVEQSAKNDDAEEKQTGLDGAKVHSCMCAGKEAIDREGP